MRYCMSSACRAEVSSKHTLTKEWRVNCLLTGMEPPAYGSNAASNREVGTLQFRTQVPRQSGNEVEVESFRLLNMFF
jgi:hypothetical protein